MLCNLYGWWSLNAGGKRVGVGLTVGDFGEICPFLLPRSKEILRFGTISPLRQVVTNTQAIFWHHYKYTRVYDCSYVSIWDHLFLIPTEVLPGS